MFGQLSGYCETGYAGYADIAVSLAVKSVVDMLKMWVHKRTRAENNPTNHYQRKVWYLAMVTQTFKCNFSTTRHSSIWITTDCIHCSLLSQLTKLAKSGIWHCHLQWQCTRSCVTYMMQKWYQWKEDELLFTYSPHLDIKMNLLLEQWAFEYGLPFCIRTVELIKTHLNMRCSF